MPRIRLEEQEDYEFSFELEVRVADLNHGGHVGSAEMAAILHDARTHLYKTLGLSEGNIGNAVGTIIADMVINFKSEAFWGDHLIVKTHVGEIEEGGMRIFQKVTKKGKPVAYGETGLVSFSFFERKKAPVPEEFLTALENYKKSLMK